jgi:hypothetical protein
MKPSAWYIFILLACVSAPASAQVAPNSSGTSDPPKAPTYTPEQLFGTLASPMPSVNSIPTPTAAQAPPPAQAQAPVGQRPSTTETRPDERAGPCAPVPTSPNDPRFPGVSASQFQRAGVSADAFTRPGVSAEQLSALTAGGAARPCQSPGNVVLYPDPVRQSRPIASPIDQP